MRHFLRERLARAVFTLPISVVAPTDARRLVLAPGDSLLLAPRQGRALGRAVLVPSVARPAQQERQPAQRTYAIQQIHAAVRAAVDLPAGSCES